METELKLNCVYSTHPIEGTARFGGDVWAGATEGKEKWGSNT